MNQYISEILKEKDDDDLNSLVAKEIINYITDIFERAEMVQIMMRKYVNEGFTVGAFINITEVSNFDEVELKLFLPEKDYKLKESERLAFKQFSEKYFNSKKSLYSKLFSLEP